MKANSGKKAFYRIRAVKKNSEAHRDVLVRILY